MEDWYYAKNGEQHGPVSRTNLVDLFKSGEIQRSTLVWTSGMDEWKRAGAVEEQIASPPSLSSSSQLESESKAEESTSQTQRRTNDAVTREQPSATSEVASNPGGFFTLKGRTNRQKYFLQVLIPTFISVFGNALISDAGGEAAGFGALLLLTGGILSIFPGTRRLHDINASGWYLLLSLVPLVNFILGLTLLFKKGTEGPNQYGPDPLKSNT
jgi:uncharacterized membrane protein YhaH (DUF805 family)